MENNQNHSPLIGVIRITAGTNASNNGMICVTCFNKEEPAKK